MDIKIDSEELWKEWDDVNGSPIALYREELQTIFLGLATTRSLANNFPFDKEIDIEKLIRVLNHEIIHDVLNCLFEKEISLAYNLVIWDDYGFPKIEEGFV